MSGPQIALAAFAALLALIALRIPIGLAMIIVGFVGSWTINATPLMVLAQLKTLPFSTFSSYSLSIVPLFLLMGQFATLGGMSTRLFEAAASWLGHRRGGLAMAAIGACAGFGAICGSSLATAATMGKVALPELRKYGYGDALATGTLAAGGTLGILIPPSIVLVIFAILTEQNIATLFAAALLPGLMAVVGYMAVIAIMARRDTSHRLLQRTAWPARLRTTLAIWPVMLVFVVVVGGIYSGFATPTEAASVGALATALIAIAGGGLTAKSVANALLETARTTAMIFLVILGAAVFNSFLALSQVPNAALDLINSSQLSPWIILCLVLLMYLVLGCFMDSLSMILLTVPILFPVMQALDFGLSPDAFAIWFGILVLIVVEVGLITPPVGLNIYVINKIAGKSNLSETYRGVLPFVASDIVRVVILLTFPILSVFVLL